MKQPSVLPEGTRYVSGELSGTSTWATTVKLLVKLPDGSQKKLFFKVNCHYLPSSVVLKSTLTRYDVIKYAIDQGAEALTAGEYHSAVVINEVLSGFVPRPVGKGKFDAGNALVYFFLGEFHDMDLSIAPEPASFMSKIATIHRTTSANGMFGFHVPTACGKMERTVTVSNPSCLSTLPVIDLAPILISCIINVHYVVGGKLGQIFHPSAQGCHQV